MRHLSKKAICAFASAVMLCGASAIPANAATKTSKNISIGNSRYGTSTGRFEPSKVELEKFKDLVSTINLNRSEVLLYEGETTTLTVNIGSETDIAKGNGTIMYQWYNENGAIEGAATHERIYVATKNEAIISCSIINQHGYFSFRYSISISGIY